MTNISSNRKNKLPQKDVKQSIDIGSNIGQVSPVMYWYRNGHFNNEHEAQGAFKLAYQQGLDGMGKGIAEWMGLTDEEFDAWLHDGSLPRVAGH